MRIFGPLFPVSIWQLVFCHFGQLWLFVIFFIPQNFGRTNAVVTVHEQDLHGEIEATNYSYYHLKTDFNSNGMSTGAVVLLLFSIEGDADLYVSRSVEKPTFAHGENDYQSTSCGIDRLDINLNVPHWHQDYRKSTTLSKAKLRPLTVGVYGHPSHPVSRYLLKVILFVDDSPLSSGDALQRNHADDSYMRDEMLRLAATDSWREWVQHVHIGDDAFGDLIDTSSFTDSRTATRSNADEFGQLFKSIAEVLLAVLSFVLNILVEILV